MGFPGQIAQGANDELAELFRRQMVEAQQQEQQRQFNARLLQDRAEMAQRGRIADTEQGQRQHIIDRQDASEAADNTSPGAISSTMAGILRKSPATAGRVTQRQTLEAKPIAGTAPLDESGPQEFDVLEPTPPQSRQQFQDSERRRIISGLSPRGRRASEMSEAGVPASVISEDMSDPVAEDARAVKRAGAIAEATAAANARHRAPASGPAPTPYKLVGPDGKERIATSIAEANQLLSQGFKSYDAVSARNPQSQSSDEGVQTSREVLRVAKQLLADPSRGSVFGAFEGALPSFRQGSIDAQSLVTQLTGLLQLDNMGKMKGVLSDADMRIIGEASTRLKSQRISDEAAFQELQTIISTVERRLSEKGISGEQGGQDAGGGEENDALAELERRRRARGGGR
jgi:hypothetical protein